MAGIAGLLWTGLGMLVFAAFMLAWAFTRALSSQVAPEELTEAPPPDDGLTSSASAGGCAAATPRDRGSRALARRPTSARDDLDGGVAELLFGVKAAGEQLEDIAKPLTAEDGEPDRPADAGATGRDLKEPEPSAHRAARAGP